MGAWRCAKRESAKTKLRRAAQVRGCVGPSTVLGSCSDSRAFGWRCRCAPRRATWRGGDWSPREINPTLRSLRRTRQPERLKRHRLPPPTVLALQESEHGVLSRRARSLFGRPRSCDLVRHILQRSAIAPRARRDQRLHRLVAAECRFHRRIERASAPATPARQCVEQPPYRAEGASQRRVASAV